MRILIAEDDRVSRMLLLKLLEGYGECDLVVDGLEALDAYALALKENKPYDLICLDIMMPKIDGVQVLKAIRGFETKKNSPIDKKSNIIVTTALAETKYIHNAMEIGCQGYITKPIDTQKFLEIVQELVLIDNKKD